MRPLKASSNGMGLARMFHTLKVRKKAGALRLAALSLSVGWALVSSSPALAAASNDALADYVSAPDDSFVWKELERREVDGVTAIRLELTSQTWRSNAWQHQMLVVRPPKVRSPDIAFLSIIGDGSVERQFALLRTMALSGGAMAAVINKVPNQPLYDGRKEDALIAYTFDQYIQTGDRTWPVLFPMVKSAVRGMDVVQAFVRTESGRNVQRFVVSGASKRGWTTWLSAAADPRVAAIAPMVIDMLNMKVQTDWAAKMYGKQSNQIRDYTDLNLVARMDAPPMAQLRQWVDPYSYRNRYRMPKLLLLGTNDPYWVVDALRNYWDELPEPKLVFQTPNAGHNLGGGREATQALAAFFQMVADRQPLPRLTWKFQSTSTNAVTIEATVEPAARTFRLWTATATPRDFRKAKWSAQELPSNPGTHAIGTVEIPAKGFRAYLLEAEMTNSAGQVYKLSTEARVVPDGPPAE